MSQNYGYGYGYGYQTNPATAAAQYAAAATNSGQAQNYAGSYQQYAQQQQQAQNIPYPENVEHYQDPIRGATTHINIIVLHKETCQEVILQLILLRLVKDIKDRQQVPIIQHWEENVPLTIWPTSTTNTMANVVQCLAGKGKPHPK